VQQKATARRLDQQVAFIAELEVSHNNNDEHIYFRIVGSIVLEKGNGLGMNDITRPLLPTYVLNSMFANVL
jgi:hypothetical protein